MIKEQIDEKTGTILFVEDEDTTNIRYLLDEVKALRMMVVDLENRLTELEYKRKRTLD